MIYSELLKYIEHNRAEWPFGVETLAQDDPRLIAFIQENYLITPAASRKAAFDEQQSSTAADDPSKFRLVKKKVVPLLFVEGGKQVSILFNGTKQIFF